MRRLSHKTEKGPCLQECIRMHERLLTAAELALWLGMTKQSVYDAIRRGRIPVVRIGKQIRVDPAVIKTWIEQGGTPLTTVA